MPGRLRLRDEGGLAARYLSLGLLVGLVAQASLALSVGPAAAAAGLLALTLATGAIWVRLASGAFRAGRVWDAGLLAAVGALAGFAAFGDGASTVLLLLPLPWLGFARLRFPARVAVAVLHALCVGVLLRLAAPASNPLVMLPIGFALLLGSLARWRRLEVGARRRGVGVALRGVAGLAAGVAGTMLAGGVPWPILFTVPAAVLAPRLRYPARGRPASTP